MGQSTAREGRCGRSAAEASQAGAERPKVRPSKVGKWRALSLLLVHVLVAVHVAHWMQGGKTLSPLEPSEAGDFSRDGVVRAGFVFFVLTIASTLVLGRWFCGWMCHIVALQDLCRWLLLRLGLRPRPVQLGILGWVPWLALIHMFVSPWLGRWVSGGGLGVREVRLTTEHFWETFPGLAVALLTFFVCGFAIVWLLGAKGFCTYGCPYGAIFGIVDQLAPARIRVTSACDGCGHCTAVCSSNVHVSQEVRDYGTVVDPGCMKCMDCVSVCPTNALYFGWGKPALFTPARKPLKRARAVSSARTALTVAFVLATFAVLEAFDGRRAAYIDRPSLTTVGIAGALALLGGWLFRGKAQRPAERTLGEEALLAALFLLALLTFRGHGWVPFLFALGLASVLAFLAFQGIMLVRRRELSLQQLRLKANGRLLGAGVGFACTLPLLAAGWTWTARHQVLHAFGAHEAEHREAGAQRTARKRAVELEDAGVRAAQEGRLEEALQSLRAALKLWPGSRSARKNLASALCASGRPAEGLAECRRLLEERAEDVAAHEIAWRACASLGEPQAALAHLREAVRLAPERADLRTALDTPGGARLRPTEDPP